jgi:SNF2 family DNA or RNA helicase
MSSLLQTDRDIRIERAAKIRAAKDIKFPPLRYWNYDACHHHDTPQVDCEYRACGGDFFNHQRVGIAWLYMMKRGLLADSTGVGKTNQILGLAALMKEKGELHDRMLIVCQTTAVLQWFEESQRWVPNINVEAAYPGLTRSQRVDKYASNWDVMIVGYHMLLKDWQMLERLDIGTLVIDDVDPLLNHDTQTHHRLDALARNTKRSVVINATTIQTRLQQIHAALVPLGGRDIFGPLDSFEKRFVRKELVASIGKQGKVTKTYHDVGYKNGAVLKEKLSPMVLRRTYDDLETGGDLRIPAIMPPRHIWLELHPAQRTRYTELQTGVMRMLREDGEQIKHVGAMVKVGYGQQICAGLAALGEEDIPSTATKLGNSVKLDWLMKAITGEWADRKVVCFIKNRGTLDALGARLDKAGIGNARIWGVDANAINRKAETDRFWRDPKCRVFMGTASIERSLNLQVANIVVNVDTHLNPARMTQILGRARRAGSTHSHVYVFNLFTRDTQEERYLHVLGRRQAVSDYVFDDQSDLYEKLSPVELLNLIKP